MQAIGFLAAALTSLALLPQLLRARRRRSTSDLSLGALAATTSGVSLWLIYGLLRGDPPLIIANIVALIPASALLMMKFDDVRRERQWL